jgi:predicted nuclease with TOPRIM domain
MYNLQQILWKEENSKVGIEEIKKRLSEVRAEQERIDKQISKQEDDGVFDSKLYDRLNELEDERNDLELMKSSLEKVS